MRQNDRSTTRRTRAEDEDEPGPGPLVGFRPPGLRDDRLTLSLPLPVLYAAQAHGSGRPPGHVVQRALGVGFRRIGKLPEYLQIERAQPAIERGTEHDIDAARDWRLEVWHCKRKSISMRNVDPALIARRAKLEEVLGLEGIAGIAVAIGLVDDPQVPAGLRRRLETAVTEFLAALRTRVGVIEDMARRTVATPNTPVTEWAELVDVRTGGSKPLLKRAGRKDGGGHVLKTKKRRMT